MTFYFQISFSYSSKLLSSSYYSGGGGCGDSYFGRIYELLICDFLWKNHPSTLLLTHAFHGSNKKQEINMEFQTIQ